MTQETQETPEIQETQETQKTHLTPETQETQKTQKTHYQIMFRCMCHPTILFLSWLSTEPPVVSLEQ